MTRKNKAGAAGGLPELKEPLAQASLPDPLLELREISYAYEGGQLALDGVSTRFYPGEKMCIRDSFWSPRSPAIPRSRY